MSNHNFKKEKSKLLAKEINGYSELISDAVAENQPPTLFIKNMIIALRKLDHISENELSFIDDLLFSELFR